MRNVFEYKKPDTIQKARQFWLHLYIQKLRHFTLRNFSRIFEIGIYIQKRMTLRVTLSLYIKKNPDTY